MSGSLGTSGRRHDGPRLPPGPHWPADIGDQAAPARGHGSHLHDAWGGDRPPAGGRARLALALLLIPLGLAVLTGLVLLWPPAGARPTTTGDASYTVPGATFRQGTVTAVSRACAPGTAADPAGDADAGPAGGLSCDGTARVTIGTAAVTVQVTPPLLRSGLRAGDQVTLLHVPAGDGAPDSWQFVDYTRRGPLLLLALVFAAAIIGVARMRGLAALFGLGLSFGLLAIFLLPALAAGEPPLPVGLTAAGTIVFVVLYLAHGPSARTSTALAGTLLGLAVTAGLGWWATIAAHLDGLGSEDNTTLLSLDPHLRLSGLILCGILIAGLGVLNDVTVTQASAVWELHASAPAMPAAQLFGRAMRIGRDHIASTVYTIVFAYAGPALAVLLLIDLSGGPLNQVLTSEDLAEEIARTLIGVTGLVLAIPITTAVAVAVVRTRRSCDTIGGHSYQ